MNTTQSPTRTDELLDFDILRDVMDSFAEGAETLNDLRSKEMTEWKAGFILRMNGMSKELEAKKGQIHAAPSLEVCSGFILANLGRRMVSAT